MTRRLMTASAVLFASSLAAPNIGHAQTFKVDIKADGGTDYVAVEAATGRVSGPRLPMVKPRSNSLQGPEHEAEINRNQEGVAKVPPPWPNRS
jgi:hypothetical protein